MRLLLISLIAFAIAAAGQQSRPAQPAASPRFVDNLDGTISDRMSGLVWEKKTQCETENETDPHCVKNVYEWSKSGSAPDGALFTSFLTKANSGNGGTGQWRIPDMDELKAIAD